jgi:hypothetical protein
MPAPSLPALERIMRKVEPEPNTGCWLWTGAATIAGYGSITVDSIQTGAHRYMWALHNGPIPSGAFICHRCDTPSCVNPDHLFVGTPRDNTRDMWRKGRARLGDNMLRATAVASRNRSARTHCNHGHAFTSENTGMEVRSRDQKLARYCRTCRSESQRRRNRTYLLKQAQADHA